AEQPFDRQAKGVLLVHRRDIVEPVEIRERLEIGLVLDELFGAAMQKADMRVSAAHDLAIELEDQAQDAVGRGMLRAKIDRKGPLFGFGDRLGHDFRRLSASCGPGSSLKGALL